MKKQPIEHIHAGYPRPDKERNIPPSWKSEPMCWVFEERDSRALVERRTYRHDMVTCSTCLKVIRNHAQLPAVLKMAHELESQAN